jgi:hypothetical protein
VRGLPPAADELQFIDREHQGSSGAGWIDKIRSRPTG